MADDNDTPPEAPSSSSSTSSGPRSLLTRKVAGFPVTTWLIMIGGAAVLGVYLRSRRSSSSAGTDAPAPVDPSTVPSTGTVPQGNNANPYPNPADSRPKTNLEWQNLAITLLIGQGQDPGIVQSALAKFLGGQPLTAQEQALVSLAIRLAGPPPEGAPAAQTTGPAQPSTPTVPVAPPGSPSSSNPTPTGPLDAYPGVDNRTLIEVGNDLLYKPNNEPDFSAVRDSLAVRLRLGTLCTSSPFWHESDNPGGPWLAVHEHVMARMAMLGWSPKC